MSAQMSASATGDRVLAEHIQSCSAATGFFGIAMAGKVALTRRRRFAAAGELVVAETLATVFGAGNAEALSCTISSATT